MTPTLTLYYVLRALLLCLAALSGFFILSAVVWVPFYASEGYSVGFQDRILGLIGECFFFVAIVIPYRWTIAAPYFHFRLALIILAATWVLWVDTRAFAAGLTRERFPPSSWLAVIVALVLFITLYMRRARHTPVRT
jgi:hypothetical protein